MAGRATKAGRTKAHRLRERLGLGLAGPVPDLLAVAERELGVPVVIPERLPDDLAGAYLPRDGHPVILLNGGDSASRLRFTLAHELAHHLFGDDRQADTQAGLVTSGHWMEVRANAFAAELLMPLPAVARYEATVASVTALAERFGTSLIASAIRIETAGLATPEAVAALREQLADAPAPALFEDGIAAAKRALPRCPNPDSPLARGLPDALARA